MIGTAPTGALSNMCFYLTVTRQRTSSDGRALANHARSKGSNQEPSMLNIANVYPG